MTYEKFLRKQYMIAQKANKEPSSALLYLLYITNKQSSELYASFNSPISKEEAYRFEEGFAKYINEDYPIQYLIGATVFFGYEFIVDPRVLIPRFETEELVEHVLEFYDEYYSGKEIKVLDLCCGSGCIGLTLALEEPNIKVTLADISEDAILLAKENAKALGAEATFIVSDLFANIDLEFDIIVSNPPYIPIAEQLPDMIKKYEPNIALFGGEDGLFFYRKIINEAHKYLKSGGIIAFEHAFNTKEVITDMLSKAFAYSFITSYNDMQNKNRITICHTLYQMKKGDVVIFPTDTVYGMGAKANDSDAISKIYDIKGRSANKHLIILCENIADIYKFAIVSDIALKVIKRYMPGALTLILPSIDGKTIGIRIPNNEVALNIIKQNGPLATTSVNYSNDAPLNDYETIKAEFQDKVDYIYPVDMKGSACASTIIQLVGEPTLLREGSISLAEVLAFIKEQ